MNSQFIRHVIIKALILFIIIDLLFVALPPDIGKISLYNLMLTGRSRFPFGENPTQSYNLSLFNLDAMFASHKIAGNPKGDGEYRVILIGDSSTWGTLLRPEETISGKLEALQLTTCSGDIVHFYNLGYPTVSLTKDLMVLEYAMQYNPDLIIWPLTLESFAIDKQLTSPIVANNAARVENLINKFDLSLDSSSTELIKPDFWAKTLIGQRRALADLIRLQIYGVLWSATGIDQTYPLDYSHAQTDFKADTSYHGQQGPILNERSLAFDVLVASLEFVGDIPVIIINEPMLISNGENSDIRYNFLYPRWAYDQWRLMMEAKATSNNWNYLDLWNIVPVDQFTNSAIHMTPHGVSLLVEQLKPLVQSQVCP